jgi:hypothetical protein
MKSDKNSDKKALRLIELEPCELLLVTGGDKVGSAGTYDYKEQICIADVVTHP